MKDWTGDSRSSFVTLGASNHSAEIREEHDYYATEPRAAELLLEQESFAHLIWECACGEGHLSKVLEQAGHEVISTDLFYRGFGWPAPVNFLSEKPEGCFTGDIITNPPYRYALEFAEQAVKVIKPDSKAAMFLKLTFLEGKNRRAFFEKNPPKTVYVSSSRLMCAKNGEFEKYPSSAVAYAWFVWEKGYCGEPVIKWIN